MIGIEIVIAYALTATVVSTALALLIRGLFLEARSNREWSRNGVARRG
jgi:hypothetical protein